MGRLTTHVLDTMHGKPAAGMAFSLSRLNEGQHELIISGMTNADGRCDQPLLTGESFQEGTYQLEFHVDAYFKKMNVAQRTGFLNVVPLRFCILNCDEHYHVPLLVSPWSYSTYRGS